MILITKYLMILIGTRPPLLKESKRSETPTTKPWQIISVNWVKPLPRPKMRLLVGAAWRLMGLPRPSAVPFPVFADAKMVAEQKDAPVSNLVKDVLILASVHWHSVEIVGIEPEVGEISRQMTTLSFLICLTILRPAQCLYSMTPTKYQKLIVKVLQRCEKLRQQL